MANLIPRGGNLVTGIYFVRMVDGVLLAHKDGLGGPALRFGCGPRKQTKEAKGVSVGSRTCAFGLSYSRCQRAMTHKVRWRRQAGITWVSIPIRALSDP